jgi:hypothetical protein
MLIHHVFFWMADDASEQDRAALRAGLDQLVTIDLIKQAHVGVPADTDRPVVDRSYAFSLLTIFATAADQDAYQVHPDHLAFIDQCKHLWTRVVVYDSI